MGGLVKEANVTSGTKPAKRPGFAGSTNSHSSHRRIALPSQEQFRQGTNHAQRQCVQGLGTV